MDVVPFFLNEIRSIPGELDIAELGLRAFQDAAQNVRQHLLFLRVPEIKADGRANDVGLWSYRCEAGVERHDAKRIAGE